MRANLNAFSSDRPCAYASCARSASCNGLVPIPSRQQPAHRSTGRCAPLACTPRWRAVCAAASAPEQVTHLQRDPTSEVPLLTFSEARDIAAVRGLALSVRELGPFYRITCRDGGDAGPIVGVSSGFTVGPLGLAHCDSLQVFTSRLTDRDGRTARDRGAGPLQPRREASFSSPSGLGLLMCGAVIAYCREHGCKKAEILAINDDDFTHARLCKYYRRMGFKVVREVGANGISDLPHQLVWGGVGTRMDADTVSFLRRWSKSIRTRRA